MTLATIFESIDQSALGTMMREDGVSFPWVESIHVIMATLVVGTILIVDLRLLGYASHRRGAKQLIIDLLPYTWIAFVGAVITGVMMFTAHAIDYPKSIPFLIKMCLIALAGINMAIFHLGAYSKIAEWDERLPTPASVKISGALSLALWVAVLFFGRWIGFSAPFA